MFPGCASFWDRLRATEHRCHSAGFGLGFYSSPGQERKSCCPLPVEAPGFRARPSGGFVETTGGFQALRV
ncbi:hypothetical protein LDENG_00254140 [Lucifuga dentata]|nr:hypothetical protein LDENG_00254140 [Lucifuga dentata]